MSAPSTNGANAKHTSGPSSPFQIAFRTIGLAAYAIDPATAGNADDANGRTIRYTPHAPSGSAPPTTSDRASPACPRRTPSSTAISPNAGVAACCEPMNVVRHDAVNVAQAAPIP